jgi:hypothetical protein
MDIGEVETSVGTTEATGDGGRLSEKVGQTLLGQLRIALFWIRAVAQQHCTKVGIAGCVTATKTVVGLKRLMNGIKCVPDQVRLHSKAEKK